MREKRLDTEQEFSMHKLVARAGIYRPYRSNCEADRGDTLLTCCQRTAAAIAASTEQQSALISLAC